MPRSVNHVASRAKRKKILKLTRGYYGSRKNVWTVAKNTWEKGLTYAYRDRKNNKRNFRALWIQRINAAARLEGMSYSKLMGALHKAGIEINRKVLADLAMNNPAVFKGIWLALYQRQEKARSYQSRLGNSSKIMKCRDKLFVPMAGHAFRGMLSTVDYKGAKALKSCLSEFHRIL